MSLLWGMKINTNLFKVESNETVTLFWTVVGNLRVLIFF